MLVSVPADVAATDPAPTPLLDTTAALDGITTPIVATTTPSGWPEPCGTCSEQDDATWRPEDAIAAVVYTSPEHRFTYREPACLCHVRETVRFWQRMRGYRVWVEVPTAPGPSLPAPTNRDGDEWAIPGSGGLVVTLDGYDPDTIYLARRGPGWCHYTGSIPAAALDQVIAALRAARHRLTTDPDQDAEATGVSS